MVFTNEITQLRRKKNIKYKSDERIRSILLKTKQVSSGKMCEKTTVYHLVLYKLKLKAIVMYGQKICAKNKVKNHLDDF